MSEPSWQRVDLSAPEYARPSEPPCTHVLYRGKRHAFSGPPEAAKTLLALLLALEHRRGGHGKFAIVDFESGEHAVRLMLEELGATADEIQSLHYYVATGPPDAETLDEMVAAGVTLAIIDALAGAYDASGLDDNKRSDAETFSRLWIQPLWKLEIATLALDHVVKNPNQRGSFSIGSERKLGTVDVHIGLEAVTQLTRGGRGLITLTTKKDRPAHLTRPHPFELHLASDPVTHRITWELRAIEVDPLGDLPPAARKLLEALEAVAGEHGAPNSVLVDWIVEEHGHGLKRETVSKMLNLLREKGYAERVNPDEAGVQAIWRGVTGCDQGVTVTPSDGGVTGVTVPLYGHTSPSHPSVTPSDVGVTVTPSENGAGGHTLADGLPVDAALDLAGPPPLPDEEADAIAALLEEGS